MLSLQPPPPPCTPPSQKQATASPLKQIVTSKESMDQHLLPSGFPHSCKRQLEGYSKLQRPRRTNPLIWCGAICCLIFSLLLIFFGIATLIIFIDIKPRLPLFDTPSATLTVVYMDSPQFLNNDFTFTANFSNPNRKLDISFDYLNIELYSFDTRIAARALQPFTQRRKETRLVAVQMISSLVYMPPTHAFELQRQVQNNRVVYHIRGTFRVRISLGIVHFSYWLHATCQLELSSPPTGVLVAHSCSTKRWQDTRISPFCISFLFLPITDDVHPFCIPLLQVEEFSMGCNCEHPFSFLFFHIIDDAHPFCIPLLQVEEFSMGCNYVW